MTSFIDPAFMEEIFELFMFLLKFNIYVTIFAAIGGAIGGLGAAMKFKR